MITSLRGTLLEGVSVYRQLSERAATGGHNSFKWARVSPTAWQSLYGEAIRLPQADVLPWHGGRLRIVAPMSGKKISVVADEGLGLYDYELCDYFRG